MGRYTMIAVKAPSGRTFCVAHGAVFADTVTNTAFEMKRPYREGDWFAVPHGDGSYSAGIVTRGTRKVVSAALFAQRFEGLPAPAAISGLDARDALWRGLMSDRAIVDGRWTIVGASSQHARGSWPAVAPSERIVAPVTLEWLAANGTLPPQRTGVRDLGERLAVSDLAAHEPATRFQWRRPLSAASLDALESWMFGHAGSSVRVYGDALAQLPSLANWSVPALTIGRGALPELPVFPNVRVLHLERALDPVALISCFPNVRSLRIAGGGALLDFGALRGLEDLEVLDCSGCSIGSLAPVSLLPRLRALRLYRTRGWSSLAELRSASLLALCIEHQIQVSDLRPLAQLRSLRQLDLRGLWQFNVEDLDWLFGCSTVRRASIDIGGRRKNVELYRRGGWGAAWPFPWLEEPWAQVAGRPPKKRERAP